MEAMPKRRGRGAAILSGMIVIAIAGIGAFYWKKFATEFYLYKIDRDPAYFLKAADQPEGSPAREAARRFVAKEGAFQRVLESLSEVSGDRGTPPAAGTGLPQRR